MNIYPVRCSCGRLLWLFEGAEFICRGCSRIHDFRGRWHPAVADH